MTRTTRTGEIINLELKSPHKLSVSNELDINLNVWSAIFSNLLHFLYDESFKFIDVIEVFTTYDKFNSSDLKKIKNAKSVIEKQITAQKIDVEKLISEFIKVS